MLIQDIWLSKFAKYVVLFGLSKLLHHNRLWWRKGERGRERGRKESWRVNKVMGIYISSSGHSKIVLTSQKETKTCFYIQHLKATLQVLTAEIYTIYTLINVFLSFNGQSLPVIFLMLHSQFMKRIWGQINQI